MNPSAVYEGVDLYMGCYFCEMMQSALEISYYIEIRFDLWDTSPVFSLNWKLSNHGVLSESWCEEQKVNTSNFILQESTDYTGQKLMIIRHMAKK